MPEGKRASGRPRNASSADAKSRGIGLFGFHWFLSIIIGPFFGYFLTDVDGWTDLENWRTVLWIRAVACWLWPVGAALALIIAAHRSMGGGGFSLGTAIGHLVVSSVCIYPALNALRDLSIGPHAETIVLADKKMERSATRSSVFYVYSVVLEDGHSYGVERETYDAVRIGDPCIATRLANTDMLLDLRPVP